MSTADCQKSGVEGKTLGLHSALFSERGDGNTRVNLENYGKNAKNRLQLVKLGWDTESPQYRQRPNRRVSDEKLGRMAHRRMPAGRGIMGETTIHQRQVQPSQGLSLRPQFTDTQ